MNLIEAKTRGLATPEKSLDARIVSTPGICGGKPRIAGSRITVKHLILDHQRGGMTPDEIASIYSGLSLGDVYAALAFYFYNRDDVDADIKTDDEQWTEIEHRNPGSLADRLNLRKVDVANNPIPPR